MTSHFKIKPVFFCAIFSVSFVLAQNYEGKWYGKLSNPAMELPLVFHLQRIGNQMKGSMDSPSENVHGIPLSNVLILEKGIEMTIEPLKISYHAHLGKDGILEGTFIQNGIQFPLSLSKNVSRAQGFKRPQEPNKPHPYQQREVRIHNSTDGITLAGTLTLPKGPGKFPAVILISGSGPQDRNQEFMGHKTFLVLADHLTRNGIAVLRYYDRGFGESTGNFHTSNSLDFAKDVVAALEFLRAQNEIEAENIGLIGHSEGGLVAPLVWERSPLVSFIVLMAAPGRTGDQVLLDQIRMQGRNSGLGEEELEKELQISMKMFQIIQNGGANEPLAKKITSYLEETLSPEDSLSLPNNMDKNEFITMKSRALTTNWMKFFLRYDPAEILGKIDVPVLAINGDKDQQIAPINLDFIKKEIMGDFTTKVFKGHNHLFQECQTGAIQEYGQIVQTISPKVLDNITHWINKTIYGQ